MGFCKVWMAPGPFGFQRRPGLWPFGYAGRELFRADGSCCRCAASTLRTRLFLLCVCELRRCIAASGSLFYLSFLPHACCAPSVGLTCWSLAVGGGVYRVWPSEWWPASLCVPGWAGVFAAFYLPPREGEPTAENEFPSSVAIFLCSAFANTS